MVNEEIEKTTDDKIQDVIRHLLGEISQKNLRPGRRGEWFSNSQLDQFRTVYERYGYKAAEIFLEGKLSKGDKKFEVKQNEILLSLLRKTKELDLYSSIASYIFGKLNAIIDQEKREQKHASK